ncbi:PREDICTED: vomeronasal type-1 receptor 3-like [Chinchilla lanigera]|uniref:vomeronasal type-1 receptor 3-like n=1 Tax=Chinchilla lanigera TaxID=34839 RepID=UPI0006990610|nr:PREDICTED: vomeronasal type-1 receptor 3-like [Chinchilla lanigera]
MRSNNLAIGIIFLSQIIIGILGNFFLLYHHFFLVHKGNSLRSTDVILKHFFVANLFVLFSRGVPHTMVVFGWKQFFSDFVCKLLSYIERVGRVVSIGTICILSFVQNIMISPMNSCWKDVKGRVLKYIGLSLRLCWILNMVFNLIIPLYSGYLSGKGYGENIRKKVNVGYCCLVDYGVVLGSIYISFVVVPEVCFSLLIIWTSGSMIFILYRHKQQVQHIHTSNVSLRSPESRATQSILLLVSTFISFYTVSTIFHTSMTPLFHTVTLCCSCVPPRSYTDGGNCLLVQLVFAVCWAVLRELAWE